MSIQLGSPTASIARYVYVHWAEICATLDWLLQTYSYAIACNVKCGSDA